MARRLLAEPSAPTSPLPVIPLPEAAAVGADSAVVVVVATVVDVVASVVVVVVTVVAVAASVAVAVAETAAAVVETVAAVVVPQGTGVALAISRGRRRDSIRDLMMIPRGIMIMSGRMNRATWAELQ